MVGRSALVVVAAVLAATSMQTSSAGSIDPSRQLPESFTQNARARSAYASEASRFGTTKKYAADGTNGVSTAAATAGIPGIDSLINWSDQFEFPGYDGNGNPQSVWPYTMIGTPPQSGQSSTIRAPIVPVTVDLLNADGSVAITFRPTQKIVNSVVNSPIFQPFTSAFGTGQYNDQMMRAQFAAHTDDGESTWHNLLAPVVQTARRMQIPYLTAGGTPAWFVKVDANGNPTLAVIDINTFANLLFPATYPFDNSTPVGAAELAGDITTKDLSSFLFNNVVLFTNGNVADCCVVGFHTYDLEPGIASNGNLPRLYVLNFNSWTSPGHFTFGAEDITAMSHELAESFDDPFVNNATPWWLVVDRFGIGNCQNNLEVGDVVEVLTGNPNFAQVMNGMTYHPQNVALFQWFAFQSHSTAQLHAYSFPDETTLLKLSPQPLLPGCVAPPPPK